MSIMVESIIRCPICGKITALEKNYKTQQIEEVHGIIWRDIGYSIGGWGRRKDFMNDFSGEVCNDCFIALKTKINEFKEVFEQRRNSCEEGVCIYKSSKDKSTGHNLPDMQNDKFQPKRHKTSLLRFLPSFLR